MRVPRTSGYSAGSLPRIALLLALGASVPRGLFAQAAVQVVSGVSCLACQVQLRPVVTVGDANGPGMLESEYSLVRRDSRGIYYVWASGAPYFWVFDGQGKIMRRVGQRGQGPGEFRSISGILIGSGDSLYVLDESQRRLSVFSPRYELVRTVQLGFEAGFRSVFVGEEILVNSMIRTPELIGYPLHLMNSLGRLTRSFGSTTGVYRPDLRDALEVRELTADAGAVWSAWINQYVIERWDTVGNLTRVLQREVDWFPTWWRPQPGRGAPPLPVTTAIQKQGDTLWVLVRVPGPDWAAAVKPRGRSFAVLDPNVYQNTMVEAIQLRTLSLRRREEGW